MTQLTSEGSSLRDVWMGQQLTGETVVHKPCYSRKKSIRKNIKLFVTANVWNWISDWLGLKYRVNETERNSRLAWNRNPLVFQLGISERNTSVVETMGWNFWLLEKEVRIGKLKLRGQSMTELIINWSWNLFFQKRIKKM